MPKLDEKNAWLKAFGEAINDRRIAVDMTQQELADLSGIHRTYVSDIERGTRNVTVTTANKIASALDMSTSKLLAVADKKFQSATEKKLKRAGT